MNLILFCLTGFLLGSFPTAYLIGKKIKGTDIRQVGSGNVGATNAFRIFGRKIGALVFLIDFLKGALPVWIYLIFKNYQHRDAALLIGAAAIFGHIFTPFLNFKGGKGVATGAGVVFASYPWIFLIASAFWVLSFKVSRVVSISSIISLVALICAAILIKTEESSIAIFLLMTLTIIWTHRSNIRRIAQKKEHKF